jgi:hypothetical protein
LDNLVEILEVEDRIINGYISPNEMNKDINFEAIRNRLEVERYKSMNFLRNALDIKV